MKTFIPKIKKIKKKWYIADAKDKILGRFISKLIKIITGKYKNIYTPHINTGDYLIIINVSKIKVSGKKKEKKTYYHHSGYPGGIKKQFFKDIIKKNPIYIIKKAIKGMLPKGPLGYNMFKKIKIYIDNKHNHIAQKPKILDF